MTFKEDYIKKYEEMKQMLIPIEEYENCLSSTLWETGKSHAFLGSMMQVMNISASYHLPTAGVSYNSSLKQYEIRINPIFFCRELKSMAERRAVLLHEIYHVLHKHLSRHDPSFLDPATRKIMNIAMDMAINQYITDLPDFCINVEDYADKKNGKLVPWKKLQTTEYYFDKLKNQPQVEDSQNRSNDPQKGSGKEDSHDDHNWDQYDEKEKLDALDELCKRALIKSALSYDKLSNHLRDLLDNIENRRAELNYKNMLLLALKASLPANVREHSWTRKSRRFGHLAPGTTYGENPKLEIFIDTSGSISVEEANNFLSIVDEFLQVGSKECNLNLFHTTNYYSAKYHKGNKLDRSVVEIGGTDLENSFRRICSKRPDLSVFLTDGCYDNVDVESLVGSGSVPRTIFVISKDGNEDHPFKNRDWARTFKIPK